MLLFTESFDTFASGAVPPNHRWTAARNSNTMSLQGARFGNGMSVNGTRWAKKEFTGTHSTMILGMAWRCGDGQTNSEVISFTDADTKQFEFNINATNSTIFCTRNGVLVGSAVAWAPVNGIFYFIEFKVTFHDTTGIAVVRIDGTTMINLSATDTKNTANAYATGVYLGDTSGNHFPIDTIDDVYVLNGVDSGVAGAPNNDFLGDCRVEARLPSGNGNSSQMVGSDGNSVDNYLLVDEATPNSDTDYVESGTVGNKDTYTFQDLTPTSGTVYGVTAMPYARKTDAGVRTIKSIARLSGVETDGPEKTLATTYQYLDDIRESKPGGGQWTIADFNSAEFGAKVFA